MESLSTINGLEFQYFDERSLVEGWTNDQKRYRFVRNDGFLCAIARTQEKLIVCV